MFPVTFESKNDKNAVINIGWLRLSSWQWPKIGIGPAKEQLKNNYWIGQHVYVIFLSGLELKKRHIVVLKH